MNAICRDARPITTIPVDLERKELDEAKALEALATQFGEHHKAVEQMAGEMKDVKDRVDELETMAARPVFREGDNLHAHRMEQEALGVLVKTGDDTELKALATDDDPQAGYLVTPELSRSINQKMFDQNPLRRISRIMTIKRGDSWQEPVDFSDVGAEWIGERQSRPETANPDVGMLTIPVNEIYAHQTVTQKLLDQSYVDIGAWIEGKIADKFGRSEGLAAVSGDGVLKPQGFLTYDTDTNDDSTRALWTLQEVVSGAATDVTADGLKDLNWALRATYRQNATWLMASATANRLDKLKDGNGNYLWKNGMASGSPESLLNRPVAFCEDMPAIGAGTYPIAFGDFLRGYTFVDQVGVKVLHDPYTNKPHVIVYVYRRVGGGVSNSEAIKLQKIAAS